MRCRPLKIAIAFALATSGVPASACVVPAIVYFDTGSAAITERSEQHLSILAQWLQRHGDGVGEVGVAGYSDRTGSRAVRLGISRRRADAVRDWLVDHGIPADRLVTFARSDTVLAVETSDGVPEPDNRRVEITVALTAAGQETETRRPPTQVGEIARCD